MQRAALILDESPSADAGLSAGARLQPHLAESADSEPDYRRYPDRYEFPHFVIPTDDGLVQFQLAVPKGKYDALALLDLFVRHHGFDDSGQEGTKVE